MSRQGRMEGCEAIGILGNCRLFFFFFLYKSIYGLM